MAVVHCEIAAASALSMVVPVLMPAVRYRRRGRTQGPQTVVVVESCS